MKSCILTALLFVISSISVRAEIISQVIDYEIDGKEFQGYLSYDAAIKKKRPGVLVVHEWWGHNDYARKRADMLAKIGYTAFALDMYGKGKLANHPDKATEFMQAVQSNIKTAEQRFNVAKSLLQKHPTVDADHIAAIGYCFGGGTVLHMARVGADLDAVVSFHGSLVPNFKSQPDKPYQISTQVLVLNGADDPFVTKEQIAAFDVEMKSAKNNYQFINYPGVKHSFTNPKADQLAKKFGMPLAYNKQADLDSWKRMKNLFQQVFD